MDAHADLGQALAKEPVSGRVVTGLPPNMISVSTFPASISSARTRSDSSWGSVDGENRRAVADGVAHVAERFVDRVDQRVHDRRLRVAGHDQRASRVALQVADACGEDTGRQRGRIRRAGGRQPQGLGERAGNRLDLGKARRVAVIREAAGNRVGVHSMT